MPKGLVARHMYTPLSDGMALVRSSPPELVTLSLLLSTMVESGRIHTTVGEGSPSVAHDRVVEPSIRTSTVGGATFTAGGTACDIWKYLGTVLDNATYVFAQGYISAYHDYFQETTLSFHCKFIDLHFACPKNLCSTSP